MLPSLNVRKTKQLCLKLLFLTNTVTEKAEKSMLKLKGLGTSGDAYSLEWSKLECYTKRCKECQIKSKYFCSCKGRDRVF